MTRKLHNGDPVAPILMKMLEGFAGSGELEKLVEQWGKFIPEGGLDPVLVAQAAAATLLFCGEKIAQGMIAQSALTAGKPACPICTAEQVMLHVACLRREMVENAAKDLPMPDAPVNPGAN